jgi:spore coat polysaccharide biosynthesis protein SpsF (cytidylyltransferase family)
MIDTLVVVQVRMSSTRLPQKALKPVCGTSILEILLTRLSNRQYNTIVATSKESSDDLVADMADSLGIQYYRGSLENVYERFVQIIDIYKPLRLVRITGDNPFVDLDELDFIISETKDQKNLYFDGIGDEGYIPGLGFEIISSDLLKRYNKEILSSKHYKEHVTTYLRENSLVTHTPQSRTYVKRNYPALSMTIDTEYDFSVLEAFLKKMKWETVKSYELVEFLLEK